MLKSRLVVSLLWRAVGIVQSRGFKHTNVVGDLKVAIDCFNAWDADEIVLLNVERGDDQHAGFVEAIKRVSSSCFLPLSVGGWIHSMERAAEIVRNGADKLVVNTAGFESPGFLTELAERFGSQCVVASIDVKETADGGYEVVTDRGRKATGIDAVAAVKRAVAAGAGEVLVTSIDRDGSLQGYDARLLKLVRDESEVPVIAFGGVGKWEHLAQGLDAGMDAVAAGNIFHYSDQSTRQAKRFLRSKNYPVR
jgi:imidazole glycerol-phosphate synthase subunit HisF